MTAKEWASARHARHDHRSAAGLLVSAGIAACAIAGAGVAFHLAIRAERGLQWLVRRLP